MLICAKLLGLYGCLGLSDGPINIPSNRLDMNARVAAALSAPVLMVLDAPSDLTLQVRSQPYAPGCVQFMLKDTGVQVFGVRAQCVRRHGLQDE